MSTVVFSEGKHDVDFLSLIHQRNFARNYDTFIQQESRDSQDTRVRQHKLDEDIDYLYKAEGGRAEVIKKFRSHATEFDDYELVLLIDLDGDDISVFMDEMHDKLGEHYGSALRIEPEKTLSNEHLQFYTCKVLINGSVNDRFVLVSFRDSLEAVTFIRDQEDRAMQIRKLHYYIDNCPGIIEDILSIVY